MVNVAVQTDEGLGHVEDVSFLTVVGVGSLAGWLEPRLFDRHASVDRPRQRLGDFRDSGMGAPSGGELDWECVDLGDGRPHVDVLDLDVLRVDDRVRRLLFAGNVIPEIYSIHRLLAVFHVSTRLTTTQTRMEKSFFRKPNYFVKEQKFCQMAYSLLN